MPSLSIGVYLNVSHTVKCPIAYVIPVPCTHLHNVHIVYHPRMMLSFHVDGI